MLHCIIHRPNRRFHITDEDFLDTSETPDHAAALRIFEWKTDALIEEFAKRYDVPEGHLPDDAYLWIDEFEVAAQQLVYLSLGTRGRTTFTDTVPELVDAGSIRERYIARRGKHARPARAYVPLCHDLAGRAFLVVENYAGDYQDKDGTWHNAFADGYTHILKQYLYCFDVVNAAIADLEGRKAKIVPRYDPQQKMVSPEHEAHRNNVFASSDTNKADTATDKTISGGNLYSVPCVEASTSEDITIKQNMSIRDTSEATNGQGQSLRTAPWTAETLIALVSAVLPVPDRATCDPVLWDKEWLRPAKLLFAATESLSPQLAWERIDLTIRWMTDATSPSWWRTGRTKQTPTSLRHVQEHYPQYYADYKKSDWHPAQTTSYDGPPLEYYQQGYTGTSPEVAETAPPVEVAPIIGMRRKVAQRLCDEIYGEYPQLTLTFVTIENSDRVQAGFEYAPDAWLDLPSFDAWRNPSPETLHYLDQALAYAAERNAISPPEVIEVQPEPPPLVLEATQDDVPAPDDEEGYVGMEEISADLQRGLRPLSSSPLVEELSMVAESLPMLPSKTGMSLVLATSLLEYLISAKQLNAELYPLAEDRAGLRIETASGWVIIEDAEAWRQYLASAQGPPAGSVVAMSAMASTMEVAQ